jgi:peptide/nickel transport system ATP-binding protein
LRSVPRLDRPRGARLETIEGLPPNLATAPPGCRFAPRCPYKIAACEQDPPLVATDTGGLSACIRAAEIAAGKISWASAGATGAASAPHATEPLLSVRGLTKHFPVKGGLGGGRATVHAVEDVSRHSVTGLSASGAARRPWPPHPSAQSHSGRDPPDADRSAAGRHSEPASCVIFQDPYSSLNWAHDGGADHL